MKVISPSPSAPRRWLALYQKLEIPPRKDHADTNAAGSRNGGHANDKCEPQTRDHPILHDLVLVFSPSSTSRRMASDRLMSRAVAQAATSLNDGSRTVTAGSRPVAGLPTFFFWCTLIDLVSAVNFVAEPSAGLSTADLVRLAFPRLDAAAIKWSHWSSVRRAAASVAVRVGRRRPGGIIWAAKP